MDSIQIVLPLLPVNEISFPEYIAQDRLSQELAGHPLATIQTLAQVPCRGHHFPILSFSFASPHLPADAPTLALVGGVHGLERIGTEVVLSYLKTFAEYSTWDSMTQNLLEKVRIQFLPMINPGGVFLGRRSNPRGIDLMRNAPIDSPEPASSFEIYRGHRISPRLPWYRGALGEPPELESLTLFDWVRKNIFPARRIITADVHSGYGTVDRVWYPYAKSRQKFPNEKEALILKNCLDRTLHKHVYSIESNSVQYTMHGDLWDYLYDEFKTVHSDRVFLPLTLEMGSWNWVKKNPFQIFKYHGLFHPMQRHRIRRILRRHIPFFDFLTRAAANDSIWNGVIR